MQPTSFEDRRRFPRVETQMTALVLGAGNFAGNYLVANLSAGGALLVGGGEMPHESGVTLMLQLPGHKALSLRADVVRRDERPGGQHHFGVAFRDVVPDEEDCLRRAVLAMLGEKNPVSRVLVVDDSSAICRALERELRTLGRVAVLAGTPVEVAGLLKDDKFEFDTAIVDLFLGPADGSEILATLAKQRPGTRRVLMSGAARAGDLKLALAIGQAHAILPKPWSREQLADALRASAGAWLSPP